MACLAGGTTLDQACGSDPPAGRRARKRPRWPVIAIATQLAQRLHPAPRRV